MKLINNIKGLDCTQVFKKLVYRYNHIVPENFTFYIDAFYQGRLRFIQLSFIDKNNEIFVITRVLTFDGMLYYLDNIFGCDFIDRI